MRNSLTLTAVLLLASTVAADIIHYKDGRRLEGQILEHTASKLTVKTSFGTIDVDMDKVSRIEERATPQEVLLEKRAGLADDDAPALYQLALWASHKKLRRESRDLMRAVLAADPAHAGANEAVGRVRMDDRWLEPAEVEA